MKKLCIALAATALAPLAMAQAAGDIVARVRAVHLDANKSTLTAGEVSINNKWLPEVDFTYFFTPNIAAELILTYPQKQDVALNGAKLGSLKHLPPTLTAQYHFTGLGALKPYLGAGLNYTRFSRVDLAGGAVTVDKSSFGLALQAGVDYAINNKWSLNLDVKKVQIRTDVSAGAANLGTFKIDPTLLAVGLGYKF
ncbi:MAG: OmpW family outer membrane protein [Burkholderiales bacterium]